MSSGAEEPSPVRRSVAVLSGKGGSGKTLVAATIAGLFADFAADNQQTVLMDADVGTAGLTYYLALRYVHNIRRGFADYVLAADADAASISKSLRPLRMGRRGREDVLFLAAGDNALLLRRKSSDEIPQALREVVRELAQRSTHLVIDCRGGIDQESLAVCAEVDDIVLVVEPDTTSVQATRHLVEVLASRQLDHKIRGFFINKALEDPSVIARNGTGLFGAQHLASIPFDIEASKAFLIGDLPARASTFTVHVRYGLSRIYEEIEAPPQAAIWRPGDFDRIGQLTPESGLGGAVIGAMALSVGVGGIIASLIGQWTQVESAFLIGLLAVLGLVGSLEPSRRLLGRRLTSFRRKGSP